MTFFLEIGNHYCHKNKASDYPVSIFGFKKVQKVLLFIRPGHLLPFVALHIIELEFHNELKRGKKFQFQICVFDFSL